MLVEAEILEATAQLILAGIDSLPVEDDAEWRGWDSSTSEVMQALIDELTTHDLFVALRSAAAPALLARHVGDARRVALRRGDDIVKQLRHGEVDEALDFWRVKLANLDRIIADMATSKYEGIRQGRQHLRVERHHLAVLLRALGVDVEDLAEEPS